MKNTALSSVVMFRTLAVLGMTPMLSQGQTWNTADGNWSTGANWTGGAVPVSDPATALIFGASGVTSYTSTNDAGNLTLNSLTINNTGTGLITLAGDPAANSLVFAGADPKIEVSAGDALFLGIMGGSATVTKTGAGTFIHDSNNSAFTGTLVVNAGKFVNQATTLPVTNFNPVSIVVNNGGTYQFGAAGVGNPNLPNTTYVTVNTGGQVLWQEGEDFGGLKLQGGTLTSTSGNMNFGGATASELQSGTINGPSGFGGGAAINKTTAGTVTVNNAAINNTGALNIQEGTLVTNTGFTGAGAMTLGTAGNSATLAFNGATATNARALTVNAGNGTVDVAAGGNYTQSAALTLDGTLTKSGAGNYTLTGATSGTGGVKITGGELALTAAPGYTGTTRVDAGTLRMTPRTAVSTSAVSIGAGGTLAVTVGAGTNSVKVPTLSLDAAGSVILMDMNGAPSTAPLVVTTADGLTLNGGGQLLRVRSQQAFSAGTFAAISYSGADITTGFTLDLGRQGGSLAYNTTAKTIDISTTGVTDTTRWGGQVSAVWDTGSSVNTGGTQNWRQNSNNAATNFIDFDNVTFDDSASGNFDVTLNTTAQTGSVRFNNSTAYTVSGTGGISGAGSLTKDGAGTATLSTVNTYSGGTVINGGILAIAGTGSLTGNVTVNTGGVLSVGTQAALANSSAIALNGGTLRITGAYAAGNNQVVTLGAGGGTVEVADTVLAAKNGNGFTGAGALTKTGGGTLSVQSGGGADFTGAVNVNNGTLRFTSTRFVNSDTVTVAAGAGILVTDTTSYNNTTAPFVVGTGKSLVLNGDGYAGTGAWAHQLDEAGSAVMGIDSPITLASTSRFNIYTGTFGTRTPADTITDVLRQPVSGPGGLIKDGDGALILAAVNTYAGTTTINAGTLLVDGSTAAGSAFIVNGGTLGGTGVINGMVTVNATAILSPGASIESLATGALTFSAASTFKYEMTTDTNIDVELNADLVESTGNLALSGDVTLNLVELGVSMMIPRLKLTLIGYDGVWNGGTFTGFADDSTFSFGANQWTINYNDTTGGLNQGGSVHASYLTLTSAVPEPSAGLLGLLASFGFLRRRKR
ncbi:MAG: autotransporter-associated beta strand repeat-containing protein [Verrucomicrobiota bacterium]